MSNLKQVRVGNVLLGGGAAVAVQSMLTTDTRNVEKSLEQIRSLVAAGCEIVRLTVPDGAAAEAFAEIKKAVPNVPLVADIHFDYRLALAALEAGADKIRINPGNLGGAENLKKVVAAAKARGVPIRVGVNAGSLEKDLSAATVAEKLAESAVRNVRLIENLDYDRIVVSAKASSVPVTVAAYQKLSQLLPYPLHLGVTEAGSPETGMLKSAAAFGALLLNDIGDTVRMSLTAEPEVEVRACWSLLRSLELRSRGVNVIACPTCGRTEVNLFALVKKVEAAVADIEKPLTVAVMGCVVNGPGEAAHADLALVGGKKMFALYRHGKLVRTLTEAEALPALLELITEER